VTRAASGWRIEGHAIISDNDCIADADGRMPQSLRNDADWSYFQRHLDEADIVITGRKGHEAHPNKPGRQRLVFTTGAGEGGFARHGDVSFLDPGRFDFFKAVQQLAPDSGIIAVTGGTAVFDWFARARLFSAFHLARAQGVHLAHGRPLFPGSGSAEERLLAHGLTLRKHWLLDEKNSVVMKIFAEVCHIAIEP
jgi:dihydrofolate reductase